MNIRSHPLLLAHFVVPCTPNRWLWKKDARPLGGKGRNCFSFVNLAKVGQDRREKGNNVVEYTINRFAVIRHAFDPAFIENIGNPTMRTWHCNDSRCYGIGRDEWLKCMHRWIYFWILYDAIFAIFLHFLRALFSAQPFSLNFSVLISPAIGLPSLMPSFCHSPLIALNSN